MTQAADHASLLELSGASTDFEDHLPSLAEADAQRALALACLVKSNETFEQLLDHHLELEKVRQASLALSGPLLESVTRDRHSSLEALEPLARLNLSALAMEARIQAALGVLNESELELVTVVSDHLIKAEPIPPRYQLAQLVIDQAEHPLPGPVLMTERLALAEPGQPATTLLAWHRLPGGLKRYVSPKEACEHVALLLGLEPQNSIIARPAPEHSFAAALLATIESAVNAAEPAEPLDAVRLELVDALTPTPHWARDHALAQVLASQGLLAIGDVNLDWLQRLSNEQRHVLINDLAEHCQAHEQARLHQQGHLPSRLSWVQDQVVRQLQADFAIEGRCQVTLDLPARLELRRLPHAGDPRQIPAFETVPSAEREQVDLGQFLLHNINTSVDSELDRRLDFLTVQVEAELAASAARVRAGIDSQWLKRTAQSLNLAQGYENVLSHYFFPSSDHADERGAVLRRPFETALRVLARTAEVLGLIDSTAQAMLARAVGAHTPEQWGSIRLQSVRLTIFNQEIHTAGAQLESVMLIVDTERPCVLLYLPYSPRATLTQHTGVSEALEYLADLCLDRKIRDYVAQRAIEGDPTWLAARISQALQSGFYHLFESVANWPLERSMAQQLLNEHAGVYVRRHRETARSNADLLGLQTDLSRQQVVNGITIALGFVPGASTLIDIGEGLYGLYKATRHFEQGASDDGLLEVQMALMALLGAAIDLLPAGAALSTEANLAVARAGRPASLAKANLQRLAAHRLRLDRPFEGYATEHSLEGVTVGTQGRFRQVYQHEGDHWILRNGQVYQVQWDATLHTWRLRRPGRAFAEQPVALSPDGNWETHGNLFGRLIQHGGQGGGNVLQRAADAAHGRVPLWLRRYLPRQVLLQIETRQQRIARVSEQVARISQDIVPMMRRAHSEEIDLSQFDSTMTLLRQQEALYDELWTALHEMTHRQRVQLYPNPEKTVAGCAHFRFFCKWQQRNLCMSRYLAAERALDQAQKVSERFALRLKQAIDSATDENATLSALSDFLESRARLRPLNARLLVETDQMLTALNAARELRPIVKPQHIRVLGPQTATTYANVDQSLAHWSFERGEGLRFDVLTRLFMRNGQSPEWVRVVNNYQQSVDVVQRALDIDISLRSGSLSKEQRAAVIHDLHTRLDTFKATLNGIAAVHPEMIDTRIHERLLEMIRAMKQRRSATPAYPAVTSSSRPAGQHPLRPFQDDQGQWYLGHREGDDLVVTRLGGAQERWVPAPRAGRYRLGAPAPEPITAIAAPVNATQVRTHARMALEKARDAVSRAERASGSSSITGADLQSMLDIEADRLDDYARQLIRFDDEEAGPLRQRLLDRAGELRREGHTLRVRFSKAPEAPSASKLAYLLDQNQVRIERVGPRCTLRGSDGVGYMDEFSIIDNENGAVLWYAHVHYPHSNSRLINFSKAHLKTVEQRHLGLNWQLSQGENAPAILRADLDVTFMYRYQARFDA